MIWFMTDPHYSHKNIVQGCSEWTDKSGCRPFATQKEHDDWIVNSINAVVSYSDQLWCLGDWSFGGKTKIREFRDRLNVATVCLLYGNHDHHIKDGDFREFGFAVADNYVELKVGRTELVLMHYPIESWVNMERGAIHLHGHVHGNIKTKPGRYEPSPEAKWVMSLDDVVKLPKATDQRHQNIQGGNKFGS